MTPIEQRDVRAGMLTVHTVDEGEARVIRLDGELDLANAGALEEVLDEAFANGTGRVVIDMSALTFIDSTGIALLVTALGRDPEAERLRFVPSAEPAVARVLKLTGVEERLPLA
jgi:anti-sigma B factor antagonist